MQSLNSVFIKSGLRVKRFLRFGKPIELAEQRSRLERFSSLLRMSENVRIEPEMIDNVPVEWIIPYGSINDMILMYLHGGAYCAGSLNTHRPFLGRLAHACGCKVLNVDYRLAPENPYPAALDDALWAYQYLLERYPGKKIFLAGDSAGGGLALALSMKLRDEKIGLPAACVLMAPWVDLTCNSDTFRSVGKKDVMLNQKRLKRNARMYAGKMDIKHPYISPVFGDLNNLPPALIMVGTHDMLLGEARLLAKNMKDAGNDVQLQVWPKMMHGWQILVDLLPEARRALRETVNFISAV